MAYRRKDSNSQFPDEPKRIWSIRLSDPSGTDTHLRERGSVMVLWLLAWLTPSLVAVRPSSSTEKYPFISRFKALDLMKWHRTFWPATQIELESKGKSGVVEIMLKEQDESWITTFQGGKEKIKKSPGNLTIITYIKQQTHSNWIF